MAAKASVTFTIPARKIKDKDEPSFLGDCLSISPENGLPGTHWARILSHRDKEVEMHLCIRRQKSRKEGENKE